jgi:1-phosphofructokinase
LEWGRHQDIDEQVVRPAGKALNVSSALAWMGQESIAAGLWGRNDFEAMRRAVQAMGEHVRLEMTPVEGSTRQNITVVDTQGGREMHLRQQNRLVTPASLARLKTTLKRIVQEGDICVFAGAMPGGELLEPAVDLVETCRRRGGRIVADTYGPVLKHLVEANLPWLIAPNVEELAQLLGTDVRDTPVKLVTAARDLLAKVPTILISRGSKGALLSTEKGAWKGKTTTRGGVLETVGCGDYLLAGFLAGFARAGNPRTALTTALKTATARAYGLTESLTWTQIRRQITMELTALS